MSSQLLERPAATDRPSFDDLLAGEGSAWTSLDSTYDRGFRAGEAKALLDHLGLILTTAHNYVGKHPQDEAAVSAFVAHLQHILVLEEAKRPFEFDGGLGI